MAIKRKHVRLLIVAIATRTRTGKELAETFGYAIDELRAFVEEYRHQIEEARHEFEEAAKEVADKVLEDDSAPVPEDKLEGFWITNKEERIERYQTVADGLLKAIKAGAWDATTLREARSYMMYAANEMGQIPLRGQGKNEGDDDVSYNINGIDMGALT